MGWGACQRDLRACQRGLRACQRGLRDCQEAKGGSENLPEGSEGLLEGPEGLSEQSEGLLERPGGLLEGPEGLPEGPEGLPEGPEGLSGGWGDGRTDGRTFVRTYGISPHSTGLCPSRGRCPISQGCIKLSVLSPSGEDGMKSKNLMKKTIEIRMCKGRLRRIRILTKNEDFLNLCNEVK